MDDTEDDARYPPNPANLTSSHHRPKLPVRSSSSAPPMSLVQSGFYNRSPFNRREEDEDEDEDDAVDDEDEDQMDEDEEENQYAKRVEQDAEEDDEDGEDEDEEDDDEQDGPGRKRKKRRLENPALAFEFVPRAKVPQMVHAVGKPSFSGVRNSPSDWTEHATFALIDAWGDRFLQLGKKSLRFEDWAEVAKRVSQVAKVNWTEAQCRNRLDTLKKKYKKEKIKATEAGNPGSKWVFFKKMDMLMGSPSPRQQTPALACGLDSGEYVFLNPRVYLNRSNGSDELRDSPGNSESEADDYVDGEDEESDSEGLPPVRARNTVSAAGEENGESSTSFRMLADSIQKFGQTYEKVENSKRQQMMELEKMRIEFHRDLEMQKRQILERAQAEIAKIQQGDDEEIDVSVENTSG